MDLSFLAVRIQNLAQAVMTQDFVIRMIEQDGGGNLVDERIKLTELMLALDGAATEFTKLQQPKSA